LVVPDHPKSGDELIFDASECQDPDGNIISYHWDFGDGNTSTGCKARHVYSESGTFIVTLTVRDDDGRSVARSKTIDVNHEISSTSPGESDLPDSETRKKNVPPEAYFSISPSHPTADEVVTFVSVSRDPDGDIEAHRWEFGDGAVSSEGPLTEHSYSKEGKFTVRLTVTDDAGDQGTKAEALEVEPRSSEPRTDTNEPPNAGFIFEPTSPKVNEIITFDASESHDPDGDIVVYRWDFADGKTSEGPDSRVECSYSESGEFLVRLTVIDDRGEDATVTKTIQIEPSITTTGDGVTYILKEPSYTLKEPLKPIEAYKIRPVVDEPEPIAGRVGFEMYSSK